MKPPNSPEVDLIGRIYDAALQPDGKLWLGVMDALRCAVNGSSAMMFTPMLRPNEGLYADVNLAPTFLQEWEANYFRQDLWTQALQAQGVARGQFTTDEMLIPPSQLVRSEYFNDYLRPHGILRHLNHVLSDEKLDATPLVFCAIYRDPKSEAFGGEELTLFRRLAPHLRRANDIFWRLRGAELRHQSDLAVLDRLAIGVVLLAPSGEVLHTNEAAQRALARNDGLGLSQRRLTAAAPAANVKLYRAIGQVCQTGNGNGQHAGGFLAIERPSGLRPWSLLIAPLPVQAPPWLGQQLPAAIVFITDPEAQPQTGSAMLAQVYGLTPGEQRLLDGLLQGLSAKEIGERHGVSFHTVRSQMKSLFEKTGVNRYGELVRMAAQGVALAGGDPG